MLVVVVVAYLSMYQLPSAPIYDAAAAVVVV
jgi:hypothetical protein